MNYTDKYIKIQGRSLLVQRVKKEEYCGLCFRWDCDHESEKISYRDSLDELNWWADIAIQKAVKSREAFYRGGELIPRWYDLEEGADLNVKYHFVPRLSFPLCALVVTPSSCFAIDYDNNILEDLSEYPDKNSEKRIGRGIFWGHWDGDNFWLLGRFNNGWRKARGMEHLPVYNSPEIDMKDVPPSIRPYTEGFWAIPLVKDHDTFIKNLKRL